MRCTDGSRMLCTGDDRSGPWQAWSDEDYDACACKMRPHETENDLPDLTDPATLGCLLALVREAWVDPWVRVEPMSREWRTLHSKAAPFCAGPTEAAALVAALEAAP